MLEATPAGVTIHYIDAGVDTGDVIAQREVALADDDTLATAYAKLQDAMAALFREQWPAIRAGTRRARGRSRRAEACTASPTAPRSSTC